MVSVLKTFKEMTKKVPYILSLCIALLFLTAAGLHAQEKQKKEKNKTARQITIEARVTDADGAPIETAFISAQEGAVSTYSAKDGSFTLKTAINGIFMIQANGYEDKVVRLEDGEISDTYVLEKRPLFSSSRDEVELPMGITVSKRSAVGAIGAISGEALESYPDLELSNALQGRIAGLTVRQESGGFGTNAAAMFVRGLGRGASDGALTVVDGIERPIGNLNVAEIERIEVLKDAPSKLLYGPRAANGVILVTTKRGKANTRVIKGSTEHGLMMATRMPAFLNAHEYASLYNEARVNDGLSPFYTDSDISGYMQSSGVNDQRHPDVDYYDYFLTNSVPVTRSAAEFLGGDDQTQYALVLGYIRGGGMEKIGTTSSNDRFNLRGNLDIEVTPSIKVFAGGAAVIDINKGGDLSAASLFSRLSSHRPNEYPFLIESEALQNEGGELGAPNVPPLGGSFLYSDNLYGRLIYGGFQQAQNFTGQANFGLEMNLDKAVKGLAAKAYFSFDNHQHFARGQTEDPVTYAQRWFQAADGSDTVAYYNLQKRVIQDNQFRKGHAISRNTGWVGNVNYRNTINHHDLSADVSYFYFRDESSGRVQDIENTNLSARVAYGFKNKYFVEGTFAYMGSNRFAPKNRYHASPAAGVAWILSEENFLKNSDAIEFLKLKGSWGILGYDRSTSFYLFEDRWYNAGNVAFNDRNQTSVPRTAIDLLGNPDLEWEKSKELNLGMEGLALNQRIQFEFNYFREQRYDIIVKPDAQYTAMHGGLFTFINHEETANEGVEGTVNWRQSIGSLHLQIGGNFIYSKSTAIKVNEVEHPDEYMRQTGNPSDAIFGYVSEGLFTDQGQVDNHAFQSLGAYGIGDIAYMDLNGDQIIDHRDRKMIGNSFPRATLGVDVDLNYKGFGLYVLGTSELNVDKMMSNSYYWNYGEGKYSTTARDRWHAVNNPDGSYPRLTTTEGSNNFTGSTFWLEDASFFRLKNVEISYTVPTAIAFAKSLRFHVRGTNLWVLSRIKDLDPEALSGGVTNSPVFRTVTGGVSFRF
jgi:TonB-linked SusC/RagA family outer membrane protein